MNYHVGRNGTQLGEFTEEQLRQGLASGSLQPTDLAWCEGMSDWAPLSSLIASAPPPAISLDKSSAPIAAVPAIPAVPSFPVSQSAFSTPVSPQPVFTGGGTSGLAIASLILGCFALLTACLTGIPAVICGHMALGRISRSGGSIGGRGLAITGLVLGYLGSSLTFIAILAGLALPAFTGVQEKARQMEASNNARMVIIMMKNYAGDNNGLYPDAAPSAPQTSNQAFRELFKSGLFQDERAFKVANSAFVADNYIGSAPDFEEALQPGENPWAMVGGLSDSSSGQAGLIFECPNDASWPPTWNADAKGDPIPGRTWKDGKIIIGRNDGSVMAEQLSAKTGSAVSLPSGPYPIFDPATPGKVLLPEQ